MNILSICIDKFIKNFLSKLFVLKRINHSVDEQVLLVLPLLGPLSFRITSRLQK